MNAEQQREKNMSQQPPKPHLPLKIHFWGCCLLAVQFISGAFLIGTMACHTWMHHLLMVNDFPAGSAALATISEALDSINLPLSLSSAINFFTIPFSSLNSLHGTRYKKIHTAILIFILTYEVLAAIYLIILDVCH